MVSFYSNPNINVTEVTNASSVTPAMNQTYDDNPFFLPWWQQTIFIFAFVVILLVASCGNVIVIWIVLAHKRMRTVMNYFIVNLAVADFLISVLNMIWTFPYLLYQDWWFGAFFCRFCLFIAPCSISASVLTFMAIAIDRHCKVRKKAKIRNRYYEAPHLTEYITWESDKNTIKDHKQEISPFPAKLKVSGVALASIPDHSCLVWHIICDSVNMFSVPVNSHESDTVRYKYNVSAVPASFLGDDWLLGEINVTNFFLYMAIMYPLRPRMSKRQVLSVILTVWIISVALSLPNLLYGNTVIGRDRTICMLTWSLNKDLTYNYLLLIMNYVFPLVTLSVTYTRVGIELWGSRAIGEDISMQHDRVKSKRKVVKMMIVVVVIFAVCWLPMHVYFLLANYNPSVSMFEFIQQIYIVIFLMAMSNSMYNPIIYCWMNSRFREGFVRVFCWCPCQPCKKIRTRLRFRRTLFPTGMTTVSDKYRDRNGSVTHTMTEYVDMDVHGAARRTSKNSTSSRSISACRRADEYV